MGPRARWRNTRPTTSETCCGNSYSAASQIKPDAARPSLAPPRQIKPRGGAGCSFPRVLGTTPPEPFEMFLRSLWKFPAAACAISRGGLRNFLKRICCQKLRKNGPPGSRTRSVAQFPTAPLKLSCRPSRRFPLICRMPPGASAGALHPCRPRRPLTAAPPPGRTPLGHSFSGQWTLDAGPHGAQFPMVFTAAASESHPAPLGIRPRAQIGAATRPGHDLPSHGTNDGNRMAH